MTAIIAQNGLKSGLAVRLGQARIGNPNIALLAESLSVITRLIRFIPMVQFPRFERSENAFT